MHRSLSFLAFPRSLLSSPLQSPSPHLRSLLPFASPPLATVLARLCESSETYARLHFLSLGSESETLRSLLDPAFPASESGSSYLSFTDPSIRRFLLHRSVEPPLLGSRTLSSLPALPFSLNPSGLPLITSIKIESLAVVVDMKDNPEEKPSGMHYAFSDIPYSISESNLQQMFSNFGEIAEVKLVKDETSKRSKGFAFIQYTSQDDAMLALENMDHQIFDGRVIYVELAKPSRDAYVGYPKTSGPPKKQYMQQQEEVTDCWY